MDDKQGIKEFSGDNVDQAIEAGLTTLGVTRDQVEISIIDEGSSGLLGFGRREAVVGLVIKKPEPQATAGIGIPSQALEGEPVKAASVPGPVTHRDNVEDFADEEQVALDVVESLLDKLKIPAEIGTRLTDPDDMTGERRIVIDVHGDDMGILIGPRGETLNALQYLSRLITGHRMQQRPTFIVDIEGYRERREQALARLAERMAKKVTARKRPISLEPMPPNERRIIHITLRDNDQVYTESSGQGQHRKVRIIPK